MPRFRIHRIKEGPKENFRWACHTGGLAIVKPKDYEQTEEREAANPYEMWKSMAAAGEALHPGDLLELLSPEQELQNTPGPLVIAKYIGFEPAQWFVPEPKPLTPALVAEANQMKSSENEANPS